MTAKKIKNLIDKFSPIIAVALFIALWYAAAVIVDAEIILPKPSVVLSNLIELLGVKAFWAAVSGTLARSLASFGISLGLALVLAVCGFLLPPLYRALSPIVTIARATPTMSIILLAIIWLTSQTSPILIACLIVFPMLYSGIYSALTEIDNGLINMAKIYKVSARDIVMRLYIPNILPSVLDSVRSAVSLNVKIIIAAEVLAQTRQSMGNTMQISRVMLDTASLLAWTAVAIIISYILELVVALIKKYVVRWKRNG